jgi:putative membrane protein
MPMMNEAPRTGQDSALRDAMALERTRLANERTLLAYVRTALALFAGAAAILQFFPDELPLTAAAWLFLILGVAAMVVGARRYMRVAGKLAQYQARQGPGG